MASKLSIEQMLAHLEEKVAHHRERQAFHAEQEALHHDQAALHSTGLNDALSRLEAFRAASLSAEEILERDKVPTRPAPEPREADFLKKRPLSRMVEKVLEGRPDDQTFGARSITREIQERWGAKLRRRPDPRTVAATLRRWAASGKIHQVREGRSYYESLYRKAP